MKVLIVGNDGQVSLESSYRRALERRGSSTRVFDWWRDGTSLPRGLAHRPVGGRVAVRGANRRLRKLAARARPDVVLVFKGLFVTAETVQAIRRTGALAICLNPDNPFNPSRTSSGPELLRAVPSWDCYFIWGRFLVDRLYAVGARRVEYLPFAWDPDLHPHQEPSPEPRYEVSFVGNYSPHRERWLSSIADMDLHVWGNGWERVGPELRPRVRGTAVLARGFSDIVRDSAVSLNVLDPWNVPGHNMRSFELPGCGGFPVSTATDELAGLFGKACALFRTEDDLRTLVRAALEDPQDRQARARAAHDRVRVETFDGRAAAILEVCDELRS
jgi:spore maturation protein CgeB